MFERRRLLAAIGVAGLALVGIGVGVAIAPNFGTVVPDHVYRSAQLSPEELSARIERYGLRSIINLRGPKEDEAWYQAEARVAAEHGVVLHDIDIVPERLPPRPAVIDLLSALETLPKPLLIHCAAGADRTGFASVIARMSLGNDSFENAREELSLRHGHLPFGPASEIGRIFDDYEAYLRVSGASDRFDTFEHWAREIYVPYVYSARIEAEHLPSEATPGERIELALRITNSSPGAWRLDGASERGIKLGVRLRHTEDDEWLDYDRHAIVRDVGAGESFAWNVMVQAPEKSSVYDVKLDLVDEHVTWFENQGSTPLSWVLRVVEPDSEAEPCF